MSRTIALAALLAATAATVGCSSQQLYAMGRQAQRNECMKSPEAAQRERCLKDADMSHDTYQREAGNPQGASR